MGGFKLRNGSAAWLVMMLGVLASAGSELVKVGGKDGWTQNVNYTEWAAHQHFYVGDWLYFVFDKHLYSVLEVNETNYEQCQDHGFITNITKGGRDVFELKQARPYYFISSGGFCYNGMKLAIDVQQNRPAPSPSAPSKSSSSAEVTGTPAFIASAIICLMAMV